MTKKKKKRQMLKEALLLHCSLAIKLASPAATIPRWQQFCRKRSWEFLDRYNKTRNRLAAQDGKLQQLWEPLHSDALECRRCLPHPMSFSLRPLGHPFIKQLSDFPTLKDSYEGEETKNTETMDKTLLTRANAKDNISYNTKFCQFDSEVIALVTTEGLELPSLAKEFVVWRPIEDDA
ncbi:hypothetical protein M9H77_04932 [Catharanthus roseus]|uniref:Uncharacterized protein n=1 Tax=Catharanthus roseus TaxID=4058 RepID=A0ACC0CFG9_CATRO|nr:hypothetical protein M9H77_04932 [Catharanthus roseus]